MKSALLKILLRNRIHDRVRGGHRISRYLTRNMDSVAIRIDSYPLLHVDLRSLDEHAVQLFISHPLPTITHEKSLTELFNRLIRPTDVVFDVGANLGLHTLTFSRLAEHVVAFEPNPALTPNLRRTIAGLNNATLCDVCLTSEDGTVEFHISEWDHMLSSLSNWSGQPTRTIEVRGCSLDSLLSNGSIPKPDVLKVDVEGAELMVFRGAKVLLSQTDSPRAIIFEELNSSSRKLGIADGEAADFLKAKGYALYLITDEGPVPLPKERPHAANLLAVKGVNPELT
jgi:FkbM family methyltransferase